MLFDMFGFTSIETMWQNFQVCYEQGRSRCLEGKAGFVWFCFLICFQWMGGDGGKNKKFIALIMPKTDSR